MYPEHEKLKAIRDKSHAIANFINWLREEKEIDLCSDDSSGEYFPVCISLDKLLAEHFEIDLVKLEKEKVEMLDTCRAYHEKKQ